MKNFGQWLETKGLDPYPKDYKEKGKPGPIKKKCNVKPHSAKNQIQVMEHEDDKQYKCPHCDGGVKIHENELCCPDCGKTKCPGRCPIKKKMK